MYLQAYATEHDCKQDWLFVRFLSNPKSIRIVVCGVLYHWKVYSFDDYKNGTLITRFTPNFDVTKYTRQKNLLPSDWSTRIFWTLYGRSGWRWRSSDICWFAKISLLWRHMFAKNISFMTSYIWKNIFYDVIYLQKFLLWRHIFAKISFKTSYICKNIWLWF